MNDLKFILRYLTRNPFIFLTNVIGLGVAITAMILAITYIRFEMSYDTHFEQKDRIVRLYHKVTRKTGSVAHGISLRSTYTELPDKVPEIEKAFQLYGGWPVSVKSTEHQVGRVKELYSDPEVIDVLRLNMIHGDKDHALVGKNQLIITETLAQQLFGSSDCVGKQVEIDGNRMTVTGVFEAIPKNSHLDMDMVISLETLNLAWFGGLEFQTYYLLKDNINRKEAEQKIATISNELLTNWASATHSEVESGVEPITRLYLNSVTGGYIPNHGNLRQLVIVGLIALFVLLTAIISYINLFIIQGEKRLTEISTRTLFGATKLNIARLFFLETLIVFVVATGIAIVITLYLLPYVSQLLQTRLDATDLLSPGGLASIGILLVALLCISTIYPVIFLSRMQYANALRGRFSGGRNNSRLSTTSVFIQFSVVAFFISCLVIITAQLQYMKRIPLGFDQNNVMTISNCTSKISGSYKSIRTELQQLPFVEVVSGGEHFMGGGCSGQLIRKTTDSENNNNGISEYRVMPGFGELMKLQLIDGRFFRESLADSQAIVLNEAAIKLLNLEPRAGQKVLYNDNLVEIIGVVKDFYYRSNPGDPIAPLVLANCFWGTPYIYIRTGTSLSAEQTKKIQDVFERFDPDYPFNATLLSDTFARMYHKENRLAKLVLFGGIMEIIISIISLLVLTILKVSRRIKEIGIRKVNGSSIAQIITLLLKETFIIVIIAILVASGVSYFVMDSWLMDYVSRIQIHPGYFLLSATFVLILTLSATIWQAWRGASRNPSESLRYE